jgi:hypothetical protein
MRHKKHYHYFGYAHVILSFFFKREVWETDPVSGTMPFVLQFFFKQDVFGNRSCFRDVVLGYPKMIGNVQNSGHIFVIPVSVSQGQMYVLTSRDSSILRYLK